MKNSTQALLNKHPFKMLCASLCGVGFLPASGTWGSLVGVFLAALLFYFPFSTFLAVVLSFFLGILVIPGLIKNQSDKDPGFIVIDELMGQLLVFAFIPATLTNPLMYFLGFILFRLFDILKPWPVSFFDKEIHNSWGIMLDDFVAGIYAADILALIQILSLY